MKNLTVLSFGGGQDSTAILLKLLMDPAAREQYVPGELLVVMSDTGNEHPYTYNHVSKTQKLCKDFGVEFVFITPDMGYHTPAWQDLVSAQIRPEGSKFKDTMVQLGTKSCTDKLKIQPIYKFLDAWLNERMGYEFPVYKTGGCNKRAMKKFYQDNGHIKVLIGFAAGEESRAKKSNKIQEREHNSENWGKCISREYPLIDMGMDRQACQEYIESQLGYCPMPSNCMLCPYQSDQEILWLYKNHQEQFNTWIEIERRKLERYAGIEKNHGVYNTKQTLQDKLDKAMEKYSDWTDEQLTEYKMSHGCQANAM